MKKSSFFFLLGVLVGLPAGRSLGAQTPYGEQPLAHTYSIVAWDPETGQMGGAVQSHWFSVGSVVLWGEAGVGVVATQSFVNPAFGPQGLQLMKIGHPPEEAVAMLVRQDEGRDYRQLAMVNRRGEVAAYTGAKCIEAAGHHVGEGYSVQANLMANDRVWGAMAEAFERSKGQPLAERLVAALKAAQEAGGDIRGKQSAALLVVAPESSGKPWEDRLVDLRVEDHPEPVAELERLLRLHRAYEHMNRGDLAVEKGDIEGALREYRSAERLFPENLEMTYWHAVTLTNVGRLEEALPLFDQVFRADANWRVLTPRLLKNGLLDVEESALQRILEQGK